MLNGALSKLLPVESGVPQGSILGPLLYTVFVNELPKVLQRSNASELRSDQRIDKICCYADDSTLSSSDSDHSELTKKLTNDFKMVSEFMINNRLKLNDDKTHLLVMQEQDHNQQSW